MQTSQNQEFGLLRLKQVLEVFPVSKSHWYEGIKAGKYPAGVMLSPGVRAWRKKDIVELIEKLSAEDQD